MSRMLTSIVACTPSEQPHGLKTSFWQTARTHAHHTRRKTNLMPTTNRKRSRYQQALVERDADEEDESSEDEEDSEGEEEDEQHAGGAADKRQRLHFSIGSKAGDSGKIGLVCHVSSSCAQWC